MLKEISLKDALLAFAGHRDVIVLMDTDGDAPQATKLSNLIDLLFIEKYHFLFDDGEVFSVRKIPHDTISVFFQGVRILPILWAAYERG